VTALLSARPWLAGTHGSDHLLAQHPGTLIGACHSPPGIACRLVWDLTHNQMAAGLTGTFLAGPVKSGLRILFVAVLALVARMLAHRMISKLTRRAAEPASRRGDAALLHRGERRYQRAQALGSLLRNLSSVVIFGIAGMTIAGYLGINLAPVLASAGVLGIAIGFGAQNLVRDFLSGIFMLLEDQYGVGDVVDAGDATGTVEAVSLRTTRLRDVNGVVWHIRNGTITRIGNQSQSWARAVVDFPVPYTEDIARVRRVMARAAGQMWSEPHWHTLMLDRPEVWGAESVSTDTVMIRLVVRTLPLRQWEVARGLRERIKAALASADGEAGRAIPAPATSPAGAAAPAGTTAPAPGPAASAAGPAEHAAAQSRGCAGPGSASLPSPAGTPGTPAAS
jgi:small-conductance mechanosensitive channel